VVDGSAPELALESFQREAAAEQSEGRQGTQ
jgi:hypothetical protein